VGPFGLISIQRKGAFLGLPPGVYICTDEIITDDPSILRNRAKQMSMGKKSLSLIGIPGPAIVSTVGILTEGDRVRGSILTLDDFDPELSNYGWFTLADNGYFQVNC